MLIAQISDAHCRPQGELYQGVIDSNAMFAGALHHLGAMRPRPDLVLFTGDLAEEGTAGEYAFARRLLDTLDLPLFAIPGNHDEREAFRNCFCDKGCLPANGPLHHVVPADGPVRIIALDVTVPGEHHGFFDAQAEAFLEEALANAPGQPTLVMMHQPPFSCAVPYLDAYWCRGGERLAALVRRYPAVERVLCGHVHRFMQTRFAGTIACTAPSTTSAIALAFEETAEAASLVEPPALLLHHWRPGAGMVTHLVPIGTFPGPFDFG